MEIVPFEPRHLLDIEPPVITQDELRVIEKSYRQLGPAFTGVEAGRAIGCAGVVIDGKNGRVWAVLSDSIRGKPFALHRAVKSGLELIVEQHGIERLEATCLAQFVTAQRWLERLGFRLADNGATFGGPSYLGYVREA